MPSRRRVLATSLVLAPGVAGCLETFSRDDTASPGDRERASDDSETLLTVANGNEEITLLTYDDVDTVDGVEEVESGERYRVTVDLTDEGTDSFGDGLESIGAVDDPESYSLLLFLDGEVIFTAKLGQGLADAIEEGRWQGDDFVLQTSRKEQATALEEALENA